MSDTLDNFLNSGLVDKVVETELIGVLELEFVVVGEQAQEDKRFEDLGGRVAFLDKLHLGQLEGLDTVGLFCRTFMTEGNRSRCMR